MVLVVVFYDMLWARNTSQIFEFYTRGRHENLDVYHISQSYFGLPRQSIRNDSDRIILFTQTLKDVESMYKDIVFTIWDTMNVNKCVVDLGVKNSTIGVLLWLETKLKVNIVYSMKAETYEENVLLRRKLFDYHKGCIPLKMEKI